MNKLARLVILGMFLLMGQGVVMTVACPYDGEPATFTGGRKLSGNGSVCEYSHLHFTTDGKSVKHTFWHDCQDK